MYACKLSLVSNSHLILELRPQGINTCVLNTGTKVGSALTDVFAMERNDNYKLSTSTSAAIRPAIKTGSDSIITSFALKCECENIKNEQTC
jgi:hypothetical protein